MSTISNLNTIPATPASCVEYLSRHSRIRRVKVQMSHTTAPARAQSTASAKRPKWNKQITNVRHIWYIIKIYDERVVASHSDPLSLSGSLICAFCLPLGLPFCGRCLTEGNPFVVLSILVVEIWKSHYFGYQTNRPRLYCFTGLCVCEWSQKVKWAMVRKKRGAIFHLPQNGGGKSVCGKSLLLLLVVCHVCPPKSVCSSMVQWYCVGGCGGEAPTGSRALLVGRDELLGGCESILHFK